MSSFLSPSGRKLWKERAKKKWVVLVDEMDASETSSPIMTLKDSLVKVCIISVDYLKVLGVYCHIDPVPCQMGMPKSVDNIYHTLAHCILYFNNLYSIKKSSVMNTSHKGLPHELAATKHSLELCSVWWGQGNKHEDSFLESVATSQHLFVSMCMCVDELSSLGLVLLCCGICCTSIPTCVVILPCKSLSTFGTVSCLGLSILELQAAYV